MCGGIFGECWNESGATITKAIDILLRFSRGLDAQRVRLAKIGFAGRVYIQKRHNRDGAVLLTIGKDRQSSQNP